MPLYSLMEDAATAEISRSQVWQWIAHRAPLVDEAGQAHVITPARLHAIIDEELAVIRRELGDARFDAGRFPAARELFERISTAPTLEDFLTLPAYDRIVAA